MIAYTNRVVNYPRHMKSEVRKLVDSMSESQKQFLLDSIKTRQNISNLTSQQYDRDLLHFIEKLLQTNDENSSVMMSLQNSNLPLYNRVY